MRITNSMMTNNFLNNMFTNLGNLSNLQNQAATQKRIFRLSEDPLGMSTIIMARSKLQKIDQYSNNVTSAQGWLSTTEDALMQANEMVKSAYERMVQMANGTYNEQDRAMAAKEVEAIRDQLVSVLNTKYGDKYVFGGYNTGMPPFEFDGTTLFYNGVDFNDTAKIDALLPQSISYEVDESEIMQVSITGAKVARIGNSNIIDIVNNAFNILNGAPGSVGPLIEDMQNVQNHLLTTVADVGGRQSRLEIIADRFVTANLTYQELLDNVQGIDLAEVTTRLKYAESVYMATLNIGSRVIQPSLLDFLR